MTGRAAVVLTIVAAFCAVCYQQTQIDAEMEEMKVLLNQNVSTYRH